MASPKLILVTGATGYIGSHISLELLRQGYAVIGVDNLSRSKYEVWEAILTQIKNSELVLFQKVDVHNVDVLSKLLKMSI